MNPAMRPSQKSSAYKSGFGSPRGRTSFPCGHHSTPPPVSSRPSFPARAPPVCRGGPGQAFSAGYRVYITVWKSLWRMCKTLHSEWMLGVTARLCKKLRNNIFPKNDPSPRERAGKDRQGRGEAEGLLPAAHENAPPETLGAQGFPGSRPSGAVFREKNDLR